MTDVPALAIEGLRKSYGACEVLTGVDLAVPAGGCVAVLGPSGCGKSTLLRIVAGLVAADAGRVAVRGRVTDDPRPRVPPEDRGVGFVFQDLALWPHLTIERNLAFVLEARRIRGADLRARIDEAAQAVGFPRELLERRPGELSGGERKRAAIARVLVQEPALVLLDEPMTSLDRDLRLVVLALLRRLRAERGLAALLVTHDRDEAFALADRVAVLRGGRVAQAGTPQEIYERPASRFVARLVGSANLLPAERVGAAVRTALGDWPADGAPNGPLLAVFRPEAVRFAPDGPARGRRVDAFFRGDHWLHAVTLEIAGGAREVFVRADGPGARGEEVRLAASRPALVPQEEDEPT